MTVTKSAKGGRTAFRVRVYRLRTDLRERAAQTALEQRVLIYLNQAHARLASHNRLLQFTHTRPLPPPAPRSQRRYRAPDRADSRERPRWRLHALQRPAATRNAERRAPFSAPTLERRAARVRVLRDRRLLNLLFQARLRGLHAHCHQDLPALLQGEQSGEASDL